MINIHTNFGKPRLSRTIDINLTMILTFDLKISRDIPRANLLEAGSKHINDIINKSNDQLDEGQEAFQEEKEQYAALSSGGSPTPCLSNIIEYFFVHKPIFSTVSYFDCLVQTLTGVNCQSCEIDAYMYIRVMQTIISDSHIRNPNN